MKKNTLNTNNAVQFKDQIKNRLNSKLSEALKSYNKASIFESTHSDIYSILDTLGVDISTIESDEEYIAIPFYDMETAENVASNMPGDLDFEIMDYSEEDFDHPYEIIIYTYNLEDEYTIEEGMKRVVRVNSKGQKVTRIKCDSGQKFNGSTCVKMSPTEIMNRRKAGRKAAMNRKASGGYG